MHSTKLQLIQGSVMLELPSELICELGLRAGDTVEIGTHNDRIVVRKCVRPRYTLEELIAQCDDSLPIDEDDRRWLDLKPVGNEIL